MLTRIQKINKNDSKLAFVLKLYERNSSLKTPVTCNFLNHNIVFSEVHSVYSEG